MKVRLLSCALILELFLSSHCLFAQQSVSQSDYVVSSPVVNMYSSPSADSNVASQVLYGTGVHSLGVKNGWVHIRTADDYTGWVLAAELHTAQHEYAPTSKYIRVSALSANLYREPSVTKHAPVLTLPWESRLEIVSSNVDNEGRWIEIQLVDGQKAFIQQGDVNKAATSLNADETIQLARRFIGITYTWGGSSSYGYDCSGFMQMLMRQRGFNIPRDAGPQANWSGVISVDRKNLRPGDLLYFGSSESKITHTGMYIGDGKFIHDTTHEHPGIQISNLDDMPWSKILVAARRVKE